MGKIATIPVIPIVENFKSHRTGRDAYVPHTVVSLMVERGWTIVRAWREHLGMTQEEVAQRLKVTQPAYSQQEASTRIRKATRERIARALGISAGQLDV